MAGEQEARQHSLWDPAEHRQVPGLSSYAEAPEAGRESKARDDVQLSANSPSIEQPTSLHTDGRKTRIRGLYYITE